ncbi:formate/nitrite transporter family protein [Zhaonella formicivorans]|uniref:formate/nitrite transporter family protein n=1 Tax=Zhaonella formicivorans TaxID=2528593 RepID=UPI0026D05C00
MPLHDRLNIDLLSPAAVTRKAETLGVEKAKNTIRSTVMLGILAGSFIAFAGEFYTVVIYDTHLGPSITKLLGGLAFSLGLILVVVAGAELFTGNTLLIIAYMTRKITFGQLLRNWALVYLGNFLGAIGTVLLIYFSEQWKLGNYAFAAQAIKIAADKVNSDLWIAFVRGILANSLVVLAVWLSYSGRTLTDKVLAVIFPVTAFVSSGFEHSIANMYFIPFGMLLKLNPEAAAAALAAYPDLHLANLNVAGFVLRNLLPVTLGNIIGGAVLVGLVYWFVYLHKKV